MSTRHPLAGHGKRVTALIAGVALTLTMAAASAEKLTLTAGSPGGGYFKAAAAFAEYIKADIPDTATTVIPGGGWANAERLDPASKLADIAVIENATATMAYQRHGPECQEIRLSYDCRGAGTEHCAGGDCGRTSVSPHSNN